MTNKIKENRLYLTAGKSIQNWNNPRVRVSIDQITIIASITLEAWEKHWKHWLQLPFIRSSGSGIQIMDTDNALEQVAYIEMPKYHSDKIRIDFNPNHSMNTKGGKWLKDTLDKLPNKHFSRVDIAFDIYNYPKIQDYDFWAYGMTKQSYYSRKQQIETKYWGSRSSQKQVRLYNKKVEQEKHHDIMTNIQDWWRLEFQFRGNSIKSYPQLIKNMLDNFYIPNYQSPNLTDNQQNKILRLLVDKNYYGKQTKSTQRRLRQLMKIANTDNSFSIVLLNTFEDNISMINKELNYYLNQVNTKNNNSLPTKIG